MTLHEKADGNISPEGTMENHRLRCRKMGGKRNAQRRNGATAQRRNGATAHRGERSGAALQPLHIHAIRCAVFMGFYPHRQLLRVYRQAVEADAQLDESLHDEADD